MPIESREPQAKPITTSQAAARLGLSISRVQQLARRRGLGTVTATPRGPVRTFTEAEMDLLSVKGAPGRPVSK